MIKNIIFDIGAVLVRINFDEFLRGKGCPKDISDRIYKASIYSKEWDELDRNVLSYDEVIESFVRNDPEIGDDIRKSFKDFNGFITMYPYAFPWINSFKEKGLKVFCLSNFPEKIRRECDDQMKFLDILDGGILSYKEKVIKPDPEIYMRLMKRYSLCENECIFIDDREENIKAARELGMNGIVFKDKESADRAALKIIGESK